MHFDAAGCIPFIFLNQATGRSKFDRGPDWAHGLDFGHAWPKGKKIIVVYVINYLYIHMLWLSRRKTSRVHFQASG